MSSVIIAGNTSGTITLDAPNVAGTTTLTLPTTSGTIITSASSLTASQLPTGSILQVVSTNKTDTFTSATGNAWTDITGMSVSITPTRSTSKIMIVVSMFGVIWQQGFNGCILSLLRGATFIGGGNAAGSRSQVIGTTVSPGYDTSQIDCGVQYHLTYIDSPATTSATTYKLQFNQDSTGNPIYINRGRTDSDSTIFPRTSSSILAMEIAA
jgi:hypothetical protein